MKKRMNAFTIVELLVVVTIIMILTSFTIYSLGPARAKSRDSRRITDANLIMNAVDQYYTSKLRTYPTESVPDSVKSDEYYAVKISAGSFLSASLSGYLNPVPTDPLEDDTHRYVYVYRGDGKKAAVIVNRLESQTKKCNIPAGTLPEAVKAYVSGDKLVGGGELSDNKACYYVAR